MRQMGLGQPSLSHLLPKIRLQLCWKVRSRQRFLCRLRFKRSLHSMLQGIQPSRIFLHPSCCHWTFRPRLQDLGLGPSSLPDLLWQMGQERRWIVRCRQRFLRHIRYQRSLHPMLQGIPHRRICMCRKCIHCSFRPRMRQMGLGQPSLPYMRP